jgi:hypothetical protein
VASPISRHNKEKGEKCPNGSTYEIVIKELDDRVETHDFYQSPTLGFSGGPPSGSSAATGY